MGLAVPDSLKLAAQEYREEEDFVAQFVAACMTTGKEPKTGRVGSSVGEVWSFYNTWAVDSGAPAYKQRELTARLKKILPCVRSNSKAWYTTAVINTEGAAASM
jgi:phage/plasmid-associated DNA primase